MSMKIPFVTFQPLERELDKELRDAFERVLSRSWYIEGAEDKEFERAFAEYIGTEYCIGCGNGLDALMLSLKALEIGEGDEVIVPSNTYIATALAVTYVGAKPVFVEPDIRTFNINPDLIEEEPDLKKLPKLGVIAKINNRMDLPNGKTRVVISGIRRARVHELLNTNKQFDIMESIVSNIENIKIDPNEENILVKKLCRELEKFVKVVPTMSNSLLATISTINNLSKLTDIVAPFLPLSLNRLNEYLLENDSKKRCEYLLSDIYRETQMYEIEKEIDLKVKQGIDESQKEFILREKIKTIKEELGDTNSKDIEIDIIREKISNLNIPQKVEERIENELKKYELLSSLSPETSVVKNYIDWLVSLPWNTYTEDNKNLKEVKEKLDKTHYGLEKIKKRIIEHLAVKQMSSDIKSPIICLVGPPGVGKTSLANSIAKAINRNFVKISVGGINDEAEIIGHRKTYLGSSPGRIIQMMKKAKSSNPVFLIDEVDKMTKDIKGDPASALLEVLDPEQNKTFSDNYIEEEFDLSKVMFILTANYLENIPEELRDRLEIININGYTEYEKLDICKKHIIKKSLKEHGLTKELINFSDEVILKIIRNYTKEAGVRELTRQIDTVIRKIVTSIVVNNMKVNELNITLDNLEQYLGKEKYHVSNINNDSKVGVVNGLAYTNYGGDVLPIEVTYFKGNGELKLTGSLGNVMKESALIALDYIKSNAKKFDINYDKLAQNDIHIHVPEGAIPKDGPSAGIALTTALISAFTDKLVSSKLAFTGEITLRGEVLKIGGLKEKCIGAYRNNIEKIIIPYDNESDLDEIPKEIKEKIKFVTVKNYEEVSKEVWK